MTTIGSADFARAVALLWIDSGLDWEFKKLWAPAQRTRFSSLSDGEGAAGQPLPYAVFEVGRYGVVGRMSGHAINEKHETRNQPLQIRVHAAQRAGDARSAKQIAAELAAAVISKLGGHPAEPPQGLPLSQGAALLLQLQAEWGMRTGDDTHMWTVDYTALIDAPVATG